jgi:hypothetical protein
MFSISKACNTKYWSWCHPSLAPLNLQMSTASFQCRLFRCAFFIANNGAGGILPKRSKNVEKCFLSFFDTSRPGGHFGRFCVSRAPGEEAFASNCRQSCFQKSAEAANSGPRGMWSDVAKPMVFAVWESHWLVLGRGATLAFFALLHLIGFGLHVSAWSVLLGGFCGFPGLAGGAPLKTRWSLGQYLGAPGCAFHVHKSWEMMTFHIIKPWLPF